MLASIPFIALVIVQAGQAGDSTQTAGDQAVLEISTRSAESLHQLLGPYSRFQWHHPGPFLFYWNAPFHVLSGDHIGGLTLAAAVLNLVLLVGFVVVAARLFGHPGAWCAALVVAVLTARFDIERLREAWNPTLTVGMTTAVLVLAVAVASGRRRALPLLAAAASFDAQIHVSAVPTSLAVIAGAAVVVVVVERGHLRRWWPKS